MKNFVVIFIMLSVIGINAQSKLEKVSMANESAEVTSYPVDPTPLLEKFNKVNNITDEQIAADMKAVKKSAAWNFTVGTTKTWYASDLSSNQFYQVPSTCRAVGSHCYIFVEDSMWTGGRVNQDAVNSVMNAFDNSTPANASKGIYQTNVETFGNPPNVDGDDKIIILILNIRDGYTGSGGFVVGYFHSYNEGSGSSSNKAEIYYLDANPLSLTTAGGLETGMSTAAHEFQHMIHYNYHPGGQETFFNEAWSLAAEVVTGYGVYGQNGTYGYNNNPNRYILYWNSADGTDVLRDYSRAARFSLYLYEQFGVDILKKFVQSSLTSVNALDYDVLPALGSSRRFADIVVDWWIANYLNDKTVDPKWGYSYSNIGTATSSKISTPSYNGSDFLYKLAAQYITYTGGTNLNITFNSSATSALKVKAIKVGTAGKTVVDVPVGSATSFPDFGTSYSNITFMVYHADRNEFSQGPFNYTYQSSGSGGTSVVEISYDTKEPTGIYNWAIGDSVAVAFDGYSGMKLDSIRVAVRTLSTINGTINRYSSTATTGKVLAKNISAVGKVYSSVPYPVPWQNWAKIDLRSAAIDASTAFVAAFAIDGIYQAGVSTGPNRVMSTYQESSNSRTLTTNSGTRRWWNFYVDQNAVQDSFITYLIRAYVSSGSSAVGDPIEILPSSFTLDQNYPNPFNPETVISYTLPKQSRVQIVIYDVLGNVVRSLIDEDKFAGKYNIMWDSRNNFGKRVSSGIYFYKISAGDFVQTKKMILMK